MTLRIATQRLFRTRLAAQRPMLMAASVRAESTLNTGEVLEDPQIGDYPNLPRYSAQTRGPYGWWDPQDKRNFGETLHEEDEIFGVWAPDLFRDDPWMALGQLGLFSVAVAGFSYFIYKTHPARPAAQRRYPYDGLKKELGGRDNDVRSPGARSDNGQ
ncbi:nadh-ubiquinone oxidoreductase ashi subunit (ci-ashi or ndufb8) domain-containing protein [Lichtheimia corymbifera JMRC:FSU:9682]|uniref:Nadh-ubiquinone oxidoreductase ashi subunit (Ci-ashi or ndufb8) domain-containing protein n=1 Tax=Lichtheimia corymbifera JMRC:FSU:9682 TaxID=1263082 RepID=A0A068S638_9FUNG|nr:nadh-ubiquinone oxidoreductase ashi subunit (ci-ashi or ndufb8) domain-containing protein [Lichtheimia corymbifera JMRC:FSU:9682]